MEILFGDKRLEKLANNYRLCQKKMGSIRAKLFNKRLDDLNTAETLEDVRYLPGHYHELREDRKGQWACDLDHPYRLIFTAYASPIPTDDFGKYIWLEIKSVEIIEIIDYH